jgi:hypothetical protein
MKEADMFYRSRIALLIALLLSLVFAVPALAGGWAVITLDELPTNVVAGESLTVGFTVLQHGRTPMSDLYPIITASLSGDAEFTVTAEQEGKPGHYTATLAFPQEGEWGWSIEAFTMSQRMPPLTVAAPGTTVANPPAKAERVSTFTSPLVLTSIAVLALGLTGAVVGYRRRSRLVLAGTVVCLLAGVALLVTGVGTASAVEAKTGPEAANVGGSSLSQVEYGRQLFIAKGCITCHVNTKAAGLSEYWTIEMGATNLSNFSASPEVLFIRLKDPAAAKSDTQMPNLDLTREEIEALIAFINSK